MVVPSLVFESTSAPALVVVSSCSSCPSCLAVCSGC